MHKKTSDYKDYQLYLGQKTQMCDIIIYILNNLVVDLKCTVILM